MDLDRPFDILLRNLARARRRSNGWVMNVLYVLEAGLGTYAEATFVRVL